jgi:hypothetical protein
MKFGTMSRSIEEAKIPGACAEMEATHAENDSSSSQILCLKVKIFFYCKQTTLPYQGSADSDARCLSEWVTPDEY